MKGGHLWLQMPGEEAALVITIIGDLEEAVPRFNDL
jgi:hypothetical protein